MSNPSDSLNNKEDVIISYADLETFQFVYSHEEDRVLIDFRATQNQRYCAILSRLCIKKAWPIFLQALQKKEGTISPVSLSSPTEERKLDERRLDERRLGKTL